MENIIAAFILIIMVASCIAPLVYVGVKNSKVTAEQFFTDLSAIGLVLLIVGLIIYWIIMP